MTLSPVNFGMTATTDAPSARHRVSFGDRDENRSLLQGLMSARDQFTAGTDTKQAKVKKGSFAKGMTKSMKYGFATMGLAFVGGLAALVVPPHIPGLLLMIGSPLIGMMGAGLGFIKGVKFG